MYFSTAKEMERLDEVAVAHGLEIRQMMELAGYHMVAVFRSEQIPSEAKIVVACGTGNKGGDGLSAARHLINNGWQHVSVVYAGNELKHDSEHHRHLLQQMSVPEVVYLDDSDTAHAWVADADVVIDSLIGYHLDGAPRGAFADLVSAINACHSTVIAYDLPSGIDATTGDAAGSAIYATATLTLALPKQLFLHADGQRHTGRLYLADIGIPAFLYDRIAQDSRPVFDGGVVRVPLTGSEQHNDVNGRE